MLAKKPYHLAEFHQGGKRVNLSKASLGEFCYEVLKCGADIYQLWAFSHQHHRSAVYPAIKATDKQVAYLRELGYNFIDPPKINLN
jgi:hypothetical protein